MSIFLVTPKNIGAALKYAGRRWPKKMVTIAVAVSVLGIACPPGAASAADPSSITSMYDAPSTTGIGSALWSGDSTSTTPGSPTADAGCAPTIQQAQGAAYAAGMKNSITISQSERKAPGKILTSCITTLIATMSSLDIFSNAGPWAMSAIINAVISYAEGLVCQVIADQFNQLVGMAFNSVAFLGDLLPCGIGVSLPGLSGSGAGMNFCSSIGGPLVSVGTTSAGSTLYTVGSSTVIPTIVSNKLGGSNVLDTLLHN